MIDSFLNENHSMSVILITLNTNSNTSNNSRVLVSIPSLFDCLVFKNFAICFLILHIFQTPKNEYQLLFYLHQDKRIVQ